MPQPLLGALAKVARANHHLDELEAEIVASDYEDAVFLAQEFDANTSTIEVTVQGVADLPLKWGLMAADALQNLRTALNYVAWELARWNLAERGDSREPIDATQFPINTSREFSRWRVADLHPDHVARIERLQPSGPTWLSQFPERVLQAHPLDYLTVGHPLAILARLTNEDKHRTFQPTLIDWRHYAFLFIGEDCVIDRPHHFLGVKIENGATWARFDVTPTGPKPEVKMDDDPIGVAVGVGDYTIEILKEKVARTVREIVRGFEPLF